MTKKTIMEQLKEAREKVEAKNGFYDLDRLFSYVADEDGVPLDSSLNSVEGHVAVRTLDALERIANALETANANQTQAKRNQTQIKGNITYHDFIKAFNALKSGYHACPNNRGGVDIVIGDRLKASLMERQSMWGFEKSTFSYKELLLMANLSAALVGLRGGISND